MKYFWRNIWGFYLVLGVLGGGLAVAREAAPPHRDLPQIHATELPREGRDALVLIRKGGPYPYAKDGSIFSNRERILPKQPRGFYREFTVKTPSSRDRGARRIVCGGKVAKQQTQVLETCFYTDDHYSSFKRIKE